MLDFPNYITFKKWIFEYESDGGKLTDAITIKIGNIIYSSPLDVVHAYEE